MFTIMRCDIDQCLILNFANIMINEKLSRMLWSVQPVVESFGGSRSTDAKKHDHYGWHGINDSSDDFTSARY